MCHVWKPTIGLIEMGARSSAEAEFHRNIPDSLSVVTTRVPLRQVSYSGMLEMMEHLPSAADILTGARPNVIAVASMTGSCIKGPEIVNSLQQQTGIRVVMPAQETVRLLRRLNCRDIALVSPFGTELNLLERVYFSGQGIQIRSVVNAVGEGNGEMFRISVIDHGLMLDQIKRADFTGIEAVVFDSPTFELEPIYGEIERYIHVPILSVNQVLLHSCLTRLGASTEGLYLAKLIPDPLYEIELGGIACTTAGEEKSG